MTAAGGPFLDNAAEITTSALRALLTSRLDPEGHRWLQHALAQTAAEPTTLARWFPEAGRRCGRGLLPRHGDLSTPTLGSHAEAPAASSTPTLGTPPAVPAEALAWTVDDAARALLLAAVPLNGPALATLAETVYRRGDAAERRAVLRALALLPVAEHAVELVTDALRTHDTRLVAAALGPYGARHLDPNAWRHAVLKCLHTHIPLTAVAGLTARRHEPELVRMAKEWAHELRCAGRPVSTDPNRLTAGRASA